MTKEFPPETEWQRRNLEFQKRKRREEEEKRAADELERLRRETFFSQRAQHGPARFDEQVPLESTETVKHFLEWEEFILEDEETSQVVSGFSSNVVANLWPEEDGDASVALASDESEQAEKSELEAANLTEDLAVDPLDDLALFEDLEIFSADSEDDEESWQGLPASQDWTEAVDLEPSYFSRSLPKVLPIFLIALIVFVLSLFTISPYSKQKEVEVKGEIHTTKQEVQLASGIGADDYISHVWQHMADYEKRVVANNPWVKSATMSYKLPNKFIITIKEYGIVAYQIADEGYYPILENGTRAQLVEVDQLPEGAMILELTKASEASQFVKQVATVDESIRQAILTVSLAPSSATEDLLLLTMADGNRIRVPLSEVASKLPYYKGIRGQLLPPSIVDMEVGIYATTDYLEQRASETKASKLEESRQQEALNGPPQAQQEATTTKTEASSSTSG